MQKRYSSTPITDHFYSKASYSKIPLSGTFELSPVCNFNCKMCYVRRTREEVQSHYRKMVTYEQWIHIAKEAREQGMLFLLLTGGEPLLWPDFWQLYEELIKMGFLISINTNGSMIDELAIEKFKKYPPKRINITLYGGSDETYERLCGIKGVYGKVIKAIEGLQEAKIPVKLSCSLTPDNQSDLEKMINYAKEKKLILQVATYMFPPIRKDESMVGENNRFTPKEAAYNRLKCYKLQNGKEKYIEYLNQILNGYTLPLGLDETCVDPLDGKIRCRAGKASFWITWDGYLTPCGLMINPQSDLYKETFSEAWESIVTQSEALVTTGICNNCSNVEICHPCTAIALAETGEFSGVPKYLCELTMEMKKIADQEINTI